MTEWWLTYLGPAQVGNIRGPRKVLTDDEVARDRALQQRTVERDEAARRRGHGQADLGLDGERIVHAAMIDRAHILRARTTEECPCRRSSAAT